jgi:hypothetical protein
VIVSKLPEPKVTMDVKNKHQAIIEFLLLEGLAGRKSCYASGTCTAQLRTVALQFSDGSIKFAAAMKKSEKKDAPEDPIDRKLMRRFGQFYKKT